MEPSHKCRLKIYEKFIELLNKYVGDGEYKEYNLDSVTIQKLAANIERGIFNSSIQSVSHKDKTWTARFQSYYMSRAYIVYVNMNPDSYLHNTNFLKRVLSKELHPFVLADLPPSERFPERWGEIMESINKDKPKIAEKTEIPDGMFKCGKCKTYKTTYTQAQTRAADESMTNFHTCLNCGNKWKS